MAHENESAPQTAGVHGRCPPPRVPMPQRGVCIGISWNGAEGAGKRIVAAKIECERERSRLVQVWRPFQDRMGRRDVVERFPAWMAEEARWAEGRLTLGLDFAFSLGETHLRQLGLLRQALRGPPALGRGLEERFLPAGVDFTEAAEVFRSSLGRDRERMTDGYRASPQAPTHARSYRETFFGLCVLARLDALFPPWDLPQAGKPVLAEVQPVHVARVLCGSSEYRDEGRDVGSRAGVRATVLRTLRSAARLEFEMEQAAPIVEDERGEVLGAVLAAVGVAAAQEAGFQGVPHNVPRSEGWIWSVREEPWRDA